MKFPPVSSTKKAAFYDTLTAELAKVPFGTYTKKDLECLLLHALFEAQVLTTRRSRDLANLLELNEPRLKGLLLDIRYKFQSDSLKENLDRVVAEILHASPPKVVHENGAFVFAIEDPVLKVDFEQGMKDVGYYSDSSFNKEIVKVRDYALVAFLFRRNNDDHTFADLQRMVAAATANERDLLAKIQQKKTWLEIGRDVVGLAQDSYGKVEVLVKLARFFSTGAFT